jgi:hypothetical protein
MMPIESINRRLLAVNGQYEVLNPWAEVDPVVPEGLSPRLSNLSGKRIGLFYTSKITSPVIHDIVERKLNERFEGINFSRFCRLPNCEVADTEDKQEYERWISEQDAVIYAVGD